MIIIIQEQEDCRFIEVEDRFEQAFVDAFATLNEGNVYADYFIGVAPSVRWVEHHISSENDAEYLRSLIRFMNLGHSHLPDDERWKRFSLDMIAHDEYRAHVAQAWAAKDAAKAAEEAGR